VTHLVWKNTTVIIVKVKNFRLVLLYSIPHLILVNQAPSFRCFLDIVKGIPLTKSEDFQVNLVFLVAFSLTKWSAKVKTCTKLHLHSNFFSNQLNSAIILISVVRPRLKCLAMFFS